MVRYSIRTTRDVFFGSKVVILLIEHVPIGDK